MRDLPVAAAGRPHAPMPRCAWAELLNAQHLESFMRTLCAACYVLWCVCAVNGMRTV